MKKLVLACAMLASVSACAQSPRSITAVSMAGSYDKLSCKSASALYDEEAAKVPSLVSQQKAAVTGDAIGVFLLAVPVSSLSGGDMEGEIATSKGKLNALDARMQECGIKKAPVSWA
ncbi:hypothetical protein K3722_07635 [Leisingera caerulea]|uniref:Lipoprotein n=1 Tax=Leisingera caerulea TaxID=506591 RepID=A0ABY5X0X0_LEICA|nr:hypothetical protein [Leisingera caerulea]UWQ59993.1 hypothetical protein K3722_07635 [Leisingera caerulea]